MSTGEEEKRSKGKREFLGRTGGWGKKEGGKQVVGSKKWALGRGGKGGTQEEGMNKAEEGNRSFRVRWGEEKTRWTEKRILREINEAGGGRN